MSLGSFLKRATTIPSHGVLSPLRKVFGSTPLDEIGQVGGFIVGGPAGAAAGGALGSLAHGAGIGSAITNAAKGYAGGVGANAALSGLGGGGLAGAASELKAGVRPFVNAGRTLFGSAAAGGGGGGGTGGLFANVLDLVKKNPELVLGGAGLVNSAVGQHGADSARNQALDIARMQYEQRAPLFAALVARMNNPQRPVSLSYRDPNNPFAG